MSNLRARLGLKDGGSLRERLGLKDGGPVHMQSGGDPTARFMGRTPKRGVSALPGYGQGNILQDIEGVSPQVAGGLDVLLTGAPIVARALASPAVGVGTFVKEAIKSGDPRDPTPRQRAGEAAQSFVTENLRLPQTEKGIEYLERGAEMLEDMPDLKLPPFLPQMAMLPPTTGVAGALKQAAKTAGKEALRPIDQAMFGEGPLAGALSMAAPMYAAPPKMQAPVSPLGFYDPVEQAALNIKRKQGPGQAFLNEIKGGEFVNKEFLQSSGLAERLAAMPNVTREEVQAMVKGTGPKVEELVLGNVKSMASEKEQKIASQLVDSIDKSPNNKIYLKDMQGPVFSDEALYYLQDGTVKPEQFPEGLQQLARDYQKAHEKTKGTQDIPTKYDREDLVFPGGSNYREVLLKLPSVRPSIKNMSRDEYNRAIQDADQRGLRDYTHSHWGSTPNVVAHIRMNDRTDLDGKKVLFIEELQSDWAQQGRKKGFADKPLTRDDLVATVNNSADRPYWEVRTKDGQFIANTGLGDKEISSQEAIDEALNLVKIRGDKRIPKGPFVTDTNEWVDLGLKNILRRAVDEGYDRVAFINGKQSADRYNLSNYVSTIDWNPPSDRLQQKGADGFVTIYLHDGNPIELPLTREGKVLKNTGTQFDGKSLGDIVGEKVAQKIMASPSGTLAGEGLSVGGKGMKDFYDQIVPDRLRKLLGKQTQIKHIPGVVRSDVPDYEVRLNKRGDGYQLFDTRTDEPLNMKFGTLDEADEYLHKLDQQNRVMPQLGFDITPEIREKFSKPIPYKKGGKVRFTDNPDVQAMVVKMAKGKGVTQAVAEATKVAAKRARDVQREKDKVAKALLKENPKITPEALEKRASDIAEKNIKWTQEEKPALEKTYGTLVKTPASASRGEKLQNIPEVVGQRAKRAEEFLAQPTEPWQPPRPALQAFDRSMIKDAMEGFPGIEQTKFPRYQPPQADLGYIEEIYQDPRNRALIETQIKRGLPLGGETFYASLYPLKMAALERGIPEEKFNQFIYSTAPASARNSIMNEMAVGQFLRDMQARGLPLDEETVKREMAAFKSKYGTGLPLMPIHREGVKNVLEGNLDLREQLKADIPTNYKIPTYGTQKAGDFGKSMVLDVHEAAGQTQGSRFHPYFNEQGGFGSREYGAAENQMLDIAQGLGIPGGMAQAGRWFGGGELTGLKSPRGDALDLLEKQAAFTLKGLGVNPTPRNVRNYLLDMIDTGQGVLMPWYKKEGMPDVRSEKKKGGAVGGLSALEREYDYA